MSTLDQVADLLSLTDEGLARNQRRFRRRRTTGYAYFSLLRLIATRTRLPLRDVSQAFAELPHLPSQDVASPSDSSLEMQVRPSEEWKGRIHPSWYPIFAALFLVAMLYVLGWVGQFIPVHR